MNARTSQRYCAALLVAICAPFATAQLQGQGLPVPSASPADTWIRQLGDPSYEVRANASRRLCMMGHAAAAALRQAAKSDEFEVTLRVKNLLAVIESVYFGGCSIRLSADKSRIRWDEPLAIVLEISNDSEYPAQLPLEKIEQEPELLREARQVGVMLDVADYLRVVGPGGEQIQLRIDDIRMDAGVAQAVEWRTSGGPILQLPAKRVLELRLAAFNRGWARFPMLKRGSYHVSFEYRPEWDDEEFRRAGVGNVTSTGIDIEVDQPAPEAVLSARQQVQVRLEREDSELIATVINCDDLPVWINSNFQDGAPPFASLNWVVVAQGETEEVRAKLDGLGAEFQRNRLIELAPGQSSELGRIQLKELLATNLVKSLPAGASFEVQANWVNLCDALWQQSQEPPLLENPRIPNDLRTPLPRRMPTGRATSSELRLFRP